MSLRSTLTLIISALGGVALMAAISLMVLTSYLHVAAGSIADSVESVRLASELRVDLLLHDRAVGPVRDDLAQRLVRGLVEVQRYVDNDEEAALVMNARTSVAKYLQSDEAKDPAAA